jgi:nuclear pore complex protein Nup205
VLKCIIIDKAYINRTLHNISKDFATKALFLSDQLDINEYVAATLLMRGTTESSRVSSNPIDAAVLLYHGERGYLLACLDVILKSTKDASISQEVKLVCSQFISELLQESVSYNNHSATGTFVTKILWTLENLSKTINAIVNTGTVAGQLPAAGSGKLGEDISELRIDRLGDERVYIVQILYHIASLFSIDTKDKLKMLELLEEAELQDPATSYMIIAMISALSNDNSIEESTPSTSTMEFIDSFHHRIMTHGSKVPVIKAVIVLQWILYISDPCRVSNVIGAANPGRSETDIKQLLDFSIATDVFGFMNEYLLYFQQPNAMIDTERQAIKNDILDNGKALDKSDYHNFNADIRDDFQPFVIYELEKLGVLVIRTLFSTLQKLKYAEEDTNTPVQAPLTKETALLSTSEQEKQCHDLQYFLTFLASVFRNRVNDSVVFWDREQGGLHYFIRWLLDIKIVATVGAAFDFFGSIATGDACAINMFVLFKAGMEADLASSALFSWGKPLAALEYYSSLLKDSTDEAPAEIPAAEEQLLLKFLGILKQCVQYSKEARLTFWYDSKIHCKEILISLLNCPTSTLLRAALFDVLSAFCSSWGGGVDDVGRCISMDMWNILQDSDMLLSSRKVTQDRAQPVYQPAGLLLELENEKRSRVFPETLSVIRLIGSAIHTQSKRQALVSGFQPARSSIPQDLGKNTRYPGAMPFISLVVDEIFVSLASQKYSFAEARWELTEACLMVMENSITCLDIKLFEMESVRKDLDEEMKSLPPSNDLVQALLAYLTHPGFQVIVRILAGGRVIDELFTVVEECAKKETKEVENMPYHKKCLVRSLRILLRVLETQDTFCNVLIPYISAFSKRKASSEFQLGEYTFPPLPSIVPLGQLILFHKTILSRIALLINYGDQEEVCFLSTKILNILSITNKDPTINRSQPLGHALSPSSRSDLATNITQVLSTSNVSEAIVFGVSERLSISMPEATTCDDYDYDINNIPFWQASETLKNTYNYPNDFKPRISTSVRLAILDLLLENTQQPFSPTLAEFLLGYDLTATNYLNKIQDTNTNRSDLVCFHAILDMLRQGMDNGIDHEDAMMEDSTEPTELLIDTHPILAEKCYALIYRLCSKKSLSISTLRYLRNRENFFYKQFDAMTSRLERNIEVESTPFGGTMICADGMQYKTDFLKLRAKLHQRAWLLRSIALELHTTVATRQISEVNKLLELLYGRTNAISSEDDDMDTSDQQQETEPGLFSMPPANKYEQPLVKMLEFVSSLEFSWRDNLMAAQEPRDLIHFPEFDPAYFVVASERGCAVYDVPAIYKALREVQEVKFANIQDQRDIETEMGFILSWVVSENHKKEIAHGKLQCLQAWKEVIHITLVECFDLTNASDRESIIYELLTLLLPKFVRVNDDTSESMLKSMSEIVLTLMNQLRKYTSKRPTSQLPVDKLRLIFTGIIDGISHQENIMVRGDLYSAITSFLLYIKRLGRDEASKQLDQAILNHIASNDAKFLDTLCRDAVNGYEIWKTTAFIALDALNTMALGASSQIVQSFMVQKNFLQNIIEMIRNDDAALSNLLEQADGRTECNQREIIFIYY